MNATFIVMLLVVIVAALVIFTLMRKQFEKMATRIEARILASLNSAMNGDMSRQTKTGEPSKNGKYKNIEPGSGMDLISRPDPSDYPGPFGQL